MVNERISIKDVAIFINGSQVGGAESAEVTLTRDNTEAYEGGNYKPVEIVDGKIHVAGTLTRAFLDVVLLNELFPNQSLAPSFTLLATVVSGKLPVRNIEIRGAKLDTINITSLELDGHATNVLPFKALDWSFS